MASTYVNNLRLNEMATGDASGTWGTTTNTNLELIGEALGYGTEAITTNADTHTSTVADGASDAARAMYIKYTGTLDSTCTITIAPNTMKRVQIIENATSGSQSIIISQGSGANVTIPTGKVAVVYLDGAGSGAAVVNAFTDLDLAGTLGVAGISSSGAIVPSASDGAALGSASLEWSDLFLADGAVINFGDDQDITLTHTADTGLATNGTFQATTITATTAFVPDASDGAALGTSSLEFSDLFLADAAVINLGDDQDTTLTHVADTGILLNSTRQLQFGDSGTYIHQSADGVLDLVSDTEIEINATTIDMNGAADVSGALTAGTVNGVGISSNITNFSKSILISNDAGTGTLSTASNNTGLGWEVFDDLTSGDDNVGIGMEALTTLTTGSGNVAIGRESMETNTTGSSNTAIGTAALAANTTADYNTAIGRESLISNTTGASNVAVGYQSLDACTTGGTNVAIGTGALSASTTQGGNTAVGYNAGLNTVTTGVTAIGYQAMATSTTGYDTVAVGQSALTANTTGHSNTAVGFNSLLSNTTGNYNVALGNGAIDSNTTGGSNTGIGTGALGANTTADNNTAVGYNALTANTTGTENVAVGKAAGDAITTGGYNTAVGTGALTATTTSGFNTAIGRNAMEANTTGGSNTAVGAQALDANTTADNNVAVGVSALGANTTGERNVVVGQGAMTANTTGGQNVAVGQGALEANTGSYNTGVGRIALNAVTSGEENTAVGFNSGTAITTGEYNSVVGVGAGNQITTANTNTAMGYDALTRCTTGGGNTAFGKDAGDNVTTGGQNVCIGQDAGTTIAQGDYNICVGSIADVSGGTNANSIAIGHNIAASGNTFSFGKASNVVSNTFTSDATWSRSSDINKKTNIKDTDLGLNFINELRPVTFNWKPNTEFPKHFKDYSETENNMDTETNLYGMIAQDVEKALDKVGHKNFGGWSEEEDGSQRLSQSMFIYPLINAVKELSAQVEELKAKLNQGE